MRIEPRILRQQSGVDVEHLAVVVLDEPGTQYAHEAGEDDQVDVGVVDLAGHRAVEGLAVVEGSVIDARRRNAGFLRALQTEGIGLVGQHEHDVEFERLRGDCVDESLKVRPAAGNQDRGAAGSGRVTQR